MGLREASPFLRPGIFPRSYRPLPLGRAASLPPETWLDCPGRCSQGGAGGAVRTRASRASTPNARQTWPDPPPPPPRGQGPGGDARATLSESLPQRHLGEGAGGRGRRRGRRAGRRRDAPQARLPGCLSHIPPDSVTCGIAPPPRALPRLPPSFQTRHHCPRPSKPQESKFPSLNLHLRRTMVRFPSAPPPPRHLDPSTPGPGDWEGPSRARVPRRGRAGSRAAWRPYLPRVVAPAAPGLRFPR